MAPHTKHNAIISPYFDDDGLGKFRADIERGIELALVACIDARLVIRAFRASVTSVLFSSSQYEAAQTLKEISHLLITQSTTFCMLCTLYHKSHRGGKI